MRRISTLVLATLVAASCDHMRTASGDYGVNFGDFTRLPGSPPFLVLEGTQLCAEDTRCGPCDAQPAICESVELEVSGPAGTATCQTAELGAPLTFTFTPQACTTPMPAESLLVDAVALSEVSARFDPDTTQPDETKDPTFPIVTQGAALPDRSVFTPLQLLADTAVKINVQLVKDLSDRIVGWNPSAGALQLTPLTGSPPVVSAALPELTLTAAAGSRASATLSLAGQDLALAELLAVGPEAVHDLEISALFYDGGADGQYPVQVEAQARDADGKYILGVPVEWRVVEGNLALDLGEDDQPNAVAGLLECLERHPDSDTRSGVIEASYGDLRATLDLTWKGYSGPDAMNAGPCAEAGCGCRSGAPDGWQGLALGLLALALRRRRPRLA